jgi:hypothetical protein
VIGSHCIGAGRDVYDDGVPPPSPVRAAGSRDLVLPPSHGAFVVALIVSLVAAVVNRWSKPRWAMLNVVLIAVVVEMSRSGGITNVNSAIRHGLGLSTRSRGCSSARSRTPGYMLFDRDTRVLRLLLASVGLPA